MGYSASLTDGDAIIIPDGFSFWLDLVETCKHYRFSWTRTTMEYMERVDDSYSQHAADMMQDYGFDDVQVDGLVISLGWWGGGTVGSSWDEIFEVIAVNADPYRWVMVGEDGAIWCEDNPNRERRVRSLDIDQAFPA